MVDAAIDAQRRALGFLTIAEALALTARGNAVLDPHSILISAAARVGGGNRFYPGVTIQVETGAEIAIGDGNVFWPGTVVAARAGSIAIGGSNQFGPGGFTASLDRSGGRIEIGSNGRFRDGASVFAGCVLGDGAQILGPIQAQAVVLGAGGDHGEPDPDRRGGVL
jgi:acetyltransferase-like isoleucine patch superfamily enzyme